MHGATIKTGILCSTPIWGMVKDQAIRVQAWTDL